MQLRQATFAQVLDRIGGTDPGEKAPLVHIIVSAMQALNEVRNLDKLEKKEMVVDVVNKIASNQAASVLICPTIDLLTRAAEGYLYLGPPRKKRFSKQQCRATPT